MAGSIGTPQNHLLHDPMINAIAGGVWVRYVLLLDFLKFSQELLDNLTYFGFSDVT